MKYIKTYEYVTSAPLLRKLTLKSKMNFGKYKDLTVQEIIDMNKKAYLRWVYYNIEGVSFINDVLDILNITNDKVIEKPGKNPELGDEIFKDNIKHMDFRTKQSYKKNKKMDNLRKSINHQKSDNSILSKGNLQRLNHGK